jgi:hypothetical protein
MILASEIVTAGLYRDINNEEEKSIDSGHSPTMNWVLERCTGITLCGPQPDASCTPLFDVRLIR